MAIGFSDVLGILKELGRCVREKVTSLKNSLNILLSCLYQ